MTENSKIHIIRAYISTDTRRITFTNEIASDFKIKDANYFLASLEPLTERDFAEAEIGAMRIAYWEKGIRDIETYTLTWPDSEHAPTSEQIKAVGEPPKR